MVIFHSIFMLIFCIYIIYIFKLNDDILKKRYSNININLL